MKSTDKPQFDWTLTEWMQWHKALVNKYSVATLFSQKTSGFQMFSNAPAAAIFNEQWRKINKNNKSFAKTQVESGKEDDNIVKEFKYFVAFKDTDIYFELIKRYNDPIFMISKFADTVGDVSLGAFKTLKTVLIVAVVFIGVVGIAYVWNTVRNASSPHYQR